MDKEVAQALIERLANRCESVLKITTADFETTLQSMVQAFLQMNAAVMAVNEICDGELLIALRMASEDEPERGAEMLLTVDTPQGLLEAVFTNEVQRSH